MPLGTTDVATYSHGSRRLALLAFALVVELVLLDLFQARLVALVLLLGLRGWVVLVVVEALIELVLIIVVVTVIIVVVFRPRPKWLGPPVVIVEGICLRWPAVLALVVLGLVEDVALADMLIMSVTET